MKILPDNIQRLFGSDVCSLHTEWIHTLIPGAHVNYPCYKWRERGTYYTLFRPHLQSTLYADHRTLN